MSDDARTPTEPAKRGRGRPRKYPLPEPQAATGATHTPAEESHVWVDLDPDAANAALEPYYEAVGTLIAVLGSRSVMALRQPATVEEIQTTVQRLSDQVDICSPYAPYRDQAMLSCVLLRHALEEGVKAHCTAGGGRYGIPLGQCLRIAREHLATCRWVTAQALSMALRQETRP
jgi:hypothetical protein